MSELLLSTLAPRTVYWWFELTFKSLQSDYGIVFNNSQNHLWNRLRKFIHIALRDRRKRNWKMCIIACWCCWCLLIWQASIVWCDMVRWWWLIWNSTLRITNSQDLSFVLCFFVFVYVPSCCFSITCTCTSRQLIVEFQVLTIWLNDFCFYEGIDKKFIQNPCFLFGFWYKKVTFSQP